MECELKTRVKNDSEFYGIGNQKTGTIIYWEVEYDEKWNGANQKAVGEKTRKNGVLEIRKRKYVDIICYMEPYKNYLLIASIYSGKLGWGH